MPNQHDAYRMAEKFDVLVNNLLAKYPPENLKNKQFWDIFCRTVRTTLTAIKKIQEKR